jgi:hypothetical protein
LFSTAGQLVSAISSPAINNKVLSANDLKKRLRQYNDLYVDGNNGNDGDNALFYFEI